MESDKLREAVAVVTGMPIHPLPPIDELIMALYGFARDAGDCSLALNIEREKTRSLKRETVQLREMMNGRN